MHGNKVWDCQNLLRNQETLTESTVSRWNSSGIFSQDSIRCSSIKSQRLLLRFDKTQETFTGSIIFYVDVQRHFLWNKDNERKCFENAEVVSIYAKKFGIGQWSFIGLGSERSGTLSVRTVHKESLTNLRRICCWNLPKVDVQFSERRAFCPEINSKAKDMENCTQSARYSEWNFDKTVFPRMEI